jgi:hypothetical protein
LAQLQVKAEMYAKEVVHDNRPSGSTAPTSEDPSASTPMNISIDPKLVRNETKDGAIGGGGAETREV